MELPATTPAFVREVLRVQFGIEIDEAEAVRIMPRIDASRQAIAAVEQFDLAEVRSSVGFDPTEPYR